MLRRRGQFATLALVVLSGVLPVVTLPSKFFPQQSGMRPAPSHDLPVLDLIESPDRMYDPKPEDLDHRQLAHQLGRNFDLRYMSVEEPLPDENPVVPLQQSNGTGRLLVATGKMPDEIKRLKFRFVLKPKGRRMTRKLRRKLRQFLWAYTHCPVLYAWKDLGLRFWPRWLRDGHCSTAHSCSFPEGMTCKASKSAGKVILRWHCQDWDRAKFCKWIPIRYPIVTACSCSC